MLDLLDRMSIYAAIVVLGYLAYSTIGQRKGFVNEGKDLPVLTKTMLTPTFIEPNDHASPVSRDPFMVRWDMYSDAVAEQAGSQGDDGDTYADGAGPDVKLMAVLTTADGHNVALIDGAVYEVGSRLEAGPLHTAWKVEAIRRDCVVLERNGVTHVLTLGNAAASPSSSGAHVKGWSEQGGGR